MLFLAVCLLCILPMIRSKQTARKSISQKCHPRSAQRTACSCAHQFNTEFGMIQVSHIQGPFSMSWSGQFQFPVPLFDLSCCPWPLAFACLLNQWTFLETIAEGRVTGNRNLATLSLPLQQEIHRLH